MLTELGYGAAAAATTSFVACRLLIAAGLVDLPNEARKAHRKPTPTSGGIGIALGFAAGLLVLSAMSAPEWRTDTLVRAALVTAFASAFMILGFLDDARPMGPKRKFFVFALLSLFSASMIGVADTLPLAPGVTLELGYGLGLAGSALFVFTLVNCVNFMDGANGLAMGSVAVGLISLCTIALHAGAPGLAALSACGAAALVGFLIWNYPKAKLFAGDSGALFAGALAALISLFAVERVNLSPFVPAILFFPLLADVLLTLAWRVSQKRRILAGHAEHMYQIGVRSKLGHARVSAIYWAACAVCGGIGYIVAENRAYAAFALAGLALASLIVSAGVRRHMRRNNMGEV